MGRLSTHVLDTARGLPAAGLTVTLWFLGPTERRLLGTFVTNCDGRTDEPLLSGDAFRVGVFELEFAAGDYLRQHHTLTEPAFLDVIPVRFGVADADAKLHVPLLLSPYGYSTYRGS